MSGYIVITRPIEDADDYADELRAAGYLPMIMPMLSIKPVSFAGVESERYDAVLVTSGNALRCYDTGVQGDYALLSLLSKPIYCVGKHTAAIAREYGFSTVVDVNGTGADMVAYLMREVITEENVRQQRFLHICGAHVAYPLVDMLRQKGVQAESITVYETVKAPAFSDEFIAALTVGDINAVTFFSKRTAESFVDLIVQNGLQSQCAGIKSLSISASVLECVRVLPWAQAYVCDTPDRRGMMELLQQHNV